MLKKSNHNKPTVQILLAYHNGSRFIEDQLNSIKNQKDVNVSLSILDDGSSEDEHVFLRSLQSKFNFKLFKKNFSSSTKSFFHLVINDSLKSDFYAFADQDDIWFEDKLIFSINALIQNQSDCYSSSFDLFSNGLNKNRFINNTTQKKYDYIFQAPGPGNTFVFSRSVIKDFKIFLQNNKNTFNYHDWMLYAYVRSKTKYRWFIDSRSTLLYRQHTTNQQGANIGIIAKKKRLKRILTHQYYDEIKILIAILNERHFLNKKGDISIAFILRNLFGLRRSYFECFVIVLCVFYSRIFYINKT